MALKEKITADLKEAMKRGDADAVSVLRMLIAAIQNKEIEKRTDSLPNADVEAVLAGEARKRKEAASAFDAGARPELAEKERKEFAFIKAYLPEEASEAEIRKAVKEAIAKTGAQGQKDMGKVIGVAMSALKGRADGATAQRVVKELLA